MKRNNLGFPKFDANTWQDFLKRAKTCVSPFGQNLDWHYNGFEMEVEQVKVLARSPAPGQNLGMLRMSPKPRLTKIPNSSMR